MAGVGVGGLQFLLVFTLLHSLIVPTDIPIHVNSHRDHYGPTRNTHLYSYRRLLNFNGHQFLRSTGGEAVAGSNRSNIGLLALGGTRVKLTHYTHNSPKYGLFTHILFNILARAGDVEVNPGPTRHINRPRSINRTNNVKGKSKKCQQCASVKRFR